MANRSKAQLAHPHHAEKRVRLVWYDRLWTWFIIALLLGVVGYSIYIQIIHHP